MIAPLVVIGIATCAISYWSTPQRLPPTESVQSHLAGQRKEIGLALYLLGLIGFAALWAVVGIVGRRQSPKATPRQITITADEDGISFDDGELRTRLRWPYFLLATESAKSFVLQGHKINAREYALRIIPKAAMTEQEVHDLRLLLGKTIHPEGEST